jgi:hypothetical protein
METTAREYPMKQTTEQTEFSSGDARVTALRNRPELARAVAARRARLRQADREYAIGLATVRNAAQLTQAELATVLGVGQAAVAKMERRPDLLLSTLRSYINGRRGPCTPRSRLCRWRPASRIGSRHHSGPRAGGCPRRRAIDRKLDASLLVRGSITEQERTPSGR